MFFDRLNGLWDFTHREEHKAPAFEYYLAPGRIHFVGNLITCKKILQDKRFVQDQSLVQLTIRTETRWLNYFLAETAEFQDGTANLQTRRKILPHIENLVQLAKSRPKPFLKLDRPTPALEIAQILSRNLLADLLSEWVGKPLELGIKLFELDIFNPSLRLKHIFKELEVELEKVVNQLPSMSEDRLLTVMSILLMGSSPLVANTTAMLNSIAKKEIIDFDYYAAYSIAPVNFVARKPTEDFVIDQVRMKAGDLVYVRLFDGCPFKIGLNLVFGAGQHICPGKVLAKVLAHQSFRVAMDLTEEECIIPSALNLNGPKAFLAYSK